MHSTSSPTGRRSIGRTAVTSLVLLVALVFSPLSSAHADEPEQPRITGTITSGGQPIEAYAVAYDADDEFVDGYWTGGDGKFELAVPPGASYRLGFQDPERQIFRSEYWNDQPTLAAAAPIVVGTSDVVGKNADLARNPQIRGTVTDENLQEIEGVSVDVFRLVDGSYEQVLNVQSGVDGRYRAPVEAGGTYKLRFKQYSNAAYQTEWFDDVTTEAEASALPVSSTITGVDVRLARLPAVTGVVTGPSGPVPHAYVTAYQQENAYYWPEINSVQADADGSYSLGLEPGEYRIGFSGGDSLAPEYYDDSPTLEGSAPVLVGAAGRTIDATLAAHPTIHGTVRADDGGAPLAGVLVDAATSFDTVDGPHWISAGSAVTKSDGTYVLGVPAGEYRLNFGGGPEHPIEYYDDATDPDQSTLVVVGADGAVADASLASNPRVEGAVTDQSGSGLPGIQVTLVVERSDGQWRTAIEGRTGTDGAYSIAAPPGSYKIRFRDDRNGRYGTEYLGGSPTLDGAEPLDLSSDVDGADVDLTEQTDLTGSVTGPGGAVAAGVKVVAIDANDYGADGEDVTISTVTSSSGHYGLALEDGTYRLRFVPPTLALRPEFWRDATSWGDATLVVVDGSVVTGVDAVLETGSGVTGTVSVPEGHQAGWVEAYRRDTDGSWGFIDEVRPTHGVFDLPLRPGTYRVKYQADWFDPIYYGGSATFGGAADVVIGEGQSHPLGDVTFGAASAVTNAVPPAVGGTPTVGSALTVSDGQWGPTSSAVTLSRQWLRDGEPIEGATGRNYTLVRDDLGARIAVQVKGVQSGLLSRSKTSAPTAPVSSGPGVKPPLVQKPAPASWVAPSIKVSAKGAKRKATLTITVRASGVTPTGKVTIKLGNKTLKTVRLKHGKAKVTLKKQKKGKRRYKVIYSGDSKVRAKTVTSKKVKIK